MRRRASLANVNKVRTLCFLLPCDNHTIYRTQFYLPYLNTFKKKCSLNSTPLTVSPVSGIYMCGLTWFSDALKVQHENEQRAEARRQKQASSPRHLHPEARLCWRSLRPPLFAASTQFMRDRPMADTRHLKAIWTYSLITGSKRPTREKQQRSNKTR